MKKLIIFLVMLLPVLVLAQGQPVANNLNMQGTSHFDPPAGNRSIPPGYLVWSQLPGDCEDGYGSQLDLVYPFDAKVADDFLFAASPGQITAVRWWILWFNGSYASPSSFNIFIYDDNACIPGNLVGSWNIPFAGANEDAGCSVAFDSREYWATLTPAFDPVPGQHYWIVIQPVLVFPPQTGTHPSTTNNLCTAKQDFPLLGNYWSDLGLDAAFELYASDAPPPAVPVSSWALLLGGVLIATVVFIRFRRIA